MDCKALGAKGYVALAYNITTAIHDARQGSPIYEIQGDHIKAVQYFPSINLLKSYLKISGNDLFLLQTFANTKSTPNLYCPYFMWSGVTFNRIGQIPCSNAKHVEPFSMDYENYVAVANYANQKGRTTTFSEIYKFNKEKKQFQLLQKIRTYGAVDVRYFSVPFEEVKRRHFLIFGNSIPRDNMDRKPDIKADAQNLEADSVFYVYEKGLFVPYQQLSFYAIEKFLPVQVRVETPRNTSQ